MKKRRISFITRMAVAAATVATAAASHAAIVYVDPPDVAVPATTAGGYIDFVTGQVATSTFAGYDLNPYRTSATTGLSFFTPNNANSGVLGVSGSGATALSAGDFIGATSTFLNGAQQSPAFRVTGTEIVGVKFVNTTTGVVNYGWAEFTTTSDTGFPAKLTRYAYEDSGASILAGQTAVPEPGTVAALAVGAGAAVWRRRRQAKAA